jgi:hypothetical protein
MRSRGFQGYVLDHAVRFLRSGSGSCLRRGTVDSIEPTLRVSTVRPAAVQSTWCGSSPPPICRHVGFVTGHRLQSGKFRFRQIHFRAGGGSFSPRADADPRRSLCHVPGHGLPDGPPHGMAQHQSCARHTSPPETVQLTPIPRDRGR